MLKFFIYCGLIILFSTSVVCGQKMNSSELIKRMNSDNQVAQLTILTIDCSQNNPEYNQNLERILRRYDIGGIYLQGGTYNEQQKMLNFCKNISRIPLFIASDILLGKNKPTSLPSLEALMALKKGNSVPFQIEPTDSTQSFIYLYGASMAKQYKAMGYNLFLLPIYEDENQIPLSDIYQSLGIVNPFMYAKMFQFFTGIQSEQVIPSIKIYSSTQQLSPENLNKYLRSLFDYKGFCYVDNDFKDDINSRRIFQSGNFFVSIENFEKQLSIINEAFIQGLIKRNDITDRCLSLLKTKEDMSPYQPSTYKETQNETLLYHQIYRDAITVVKNEYNFLPLKRLDTLRIASINFGCDTINTFQTRLSSYAQVSHFTYNKLSRENSAQLVNKLDSYNCIIIYNSLQDVSPELIYLLVGFGKKNVVLCNNDLPMSLNNYIYTSVNAIVNHYDLNPIAQDYTAQAIFGGIKTQGILPHNVNAVLHAGYGEDLPKTRLSYNLRSEFIQKIDYQLLSSKIDSICKTSIEKEVAPGCQVLIAKDNEIIFNRAYGYHTYEKKTANESQDIYDIASLTKISATLPAVMKLYCENKIVLDARLSTYCPEFKTTDKRYITVRQLLTHTSGVRGTINPFTSAVNCRYSPNGSWSSEVRTKYFYQKLSSRLYINPKFSYKSQTLSNKPIGDYVPVTQGIYASPSYLERVKKSIISTPIQQANKYIYSDLGFVYLQRIVENISQSSLDTFCQKEIFDKLGAYNTAFNPLGRLDSCRIIPSCNDRWFRHSEVCGTVHDPMAAFLGGVAGNAGLFSTAEDLAKIMTLYLNDGFYGNEQIFCKGCVKTFSTKCDKYPRNRRGLGFDKPGIRYDNVSVASKKAPQSSFGHTGFTGTMAWCDPDNRLIYIFLSNRTYPNEYNNKLLDQGVRTKIQSVIYDCLKNPAED